MHVLSAGLPATAPNGTIFGLAIADASGNPITTLPAAAQLAMARNAADLTMANGNANLLTAAYMVDGNTPAIANPNREPSGTWVFFPPSGVSLDAAHGIMTVNTQADQRFDERVRQPGRLRPGPQPKRGAVFQLRSGLGSDVRRQAAVHVPSDGRPQVGSRLHVCWDPATKNYAYVNASAVGPSGAPPS